ncbi:sensor histidine kinase [Paenibacillus agricola]|uniref:Oxygen sensor histidine kinase NreB n=1 Tax=Paenibacillus agricola TaxID=2716264 RepID=A0ABX0IZV6_9BACL|nr:PAS domain S-box protein [Paenibacillus agricola]NHN29519.1 PAS domain S-box protein [Paenibacillus agricola]
MQFLVYVLTAALVIVTGWAAALLYILLKKSLPFENRLKALLHATSELSIIATDLKGTITFFNSGAEYLLGYKAEEVIAKETPFIFHDPVEVIKRSKELTAELGKMVEGFDVFVESSKKGKAEKKEWTYIRKNGSHFPVTLIVTPIRNVRREITGHLGIAFDISKEKRLEQGLKNSTENYKLLLDYSPNMVIVHQDKRIVYLNNAAHGMLDLEEGIDVVASSIDEFIHPQYKEEILAAKGQSAYMEMVMVSRKGRNMDMELHHITVSYHDKPAKMIIAKDITANKQTMEMNKRLISILEETEDLIVITDVDGKMIYLNHSMKVMMGYDEEQDWVQISVTDLYPQWEGKLIRHEAFYIASKQGCWKGGTAFKLRNGKSLSVFQTILAHKDTSGHVQFYSLVAKDLSVIRMEEEARLSKVIIQKTLEAQEKERTALAQELHDGVGQSLYYVSISLHTLSGTIADEHYMKLIQSMLEQLDHAIKEIRTYSLRLRPQLLDHLGLSATIKSLVHSYQIAYPQISITFNNQPVVKGNDSNIDIHLYRIVQEGLNNAIKHAEASEIEVTLIREESDIQLRIRDNGKGIHKEQIGAGMGLRHMEERVNTLGGHFHVNTSQNRGTELVADVPIHPNSLDIRIEERRMSNDE